jgi:hypothetical protein
LYLGSRSLSLKELTLILEEFFWVFFKIKDKNSKNFKYALTNSKFLHQYAPYIQNGKPFTAKKHCLWSLAIQDDIELLKTYERFGFKYEFKDFVKISKDRGAKKILDYLIRETELASGTPESNITVCDNLTSRECSVLSPDHESSDEETGTTLTVTTLAKSCNLQVCQRVIINLTLTNREQNVPFMIL